VDPRIWNDQKFRELSDNAKLVFFMLLTHPNMTAIGAMRATLAGLAEEMGWEAEAFREAFCQVQSKGMAEHDKKACLISLPNFIKYNPPESPNVVKAWVNALDLLPECSLKTRVIARAAAYAKAMNKGFAEALPEAFAKSMPYQEQEQEQEQEQDKSAPNGAVNSPDGELDLQGADEDEEIAKAADLPCPVGSLVNLYHECMPLNPQVRVLNDQRKRAIRARWREAAALTCKPFGYKTKDEGMAAWREFFEVCAESDFLTGRAKAQPGKPPFLADIDFLFSPAGFAKCLENKYHREAA
jgi:hypothetical protein